MSKLFLSFLFTAFTIFSFAQNKVINDVNAEKRSVKDFHAIKVSTGIVLILSQGNEEAVAVSASKTEDRDRIVTVVENGVLKIYYDNKSMSYSTNNKKLRAYVSCKILDALSASSGALVNVDGTIKSAKLDLNFSSGSNFTGNINVSDLKVDASSGSTSTISGTATTVSAEGSSGSALHASGLESETYTVSVSSGADFDISVHKTLLASAHSGGNISYKGDAATVTINKGSGGNVSKK